MRIPMQHIAEPRLDCYYHGRSTLGGRVVGSTCNGYVTVHCALSTPTAPMD